MKKKIVALCTAGIIALVSAVGVFGEEALKIKGTVTKIDLTAKSVTIQPKEGEPVTVLFEDGDVLDKVKEGGKGQALYSVQNGRNIGIKLRKLTAGCQ